MSSFPPVSVAIVGCGAVSQRYYTPALQELARQGVLRVIALNDPDPRSLTQLQRSFPNARSTANLNELTAGSLDLAIVASPPRFHAQQTIQLLKAGLSVLCEKPMATSVADAEAMIAAASEAPGILAVGLFRRFFPATEMIQQMLAHNLLGDIVSFSFSEGGMFRWPVQSPDYFHKATANGGVLMDLGVHALDLMLWWLGDPDDMVYEDDAMGGIEANCRLRCRFAHGAAGEIHLSRDCAVPNRYLIHGTKGWLSWEVNEASDIELGLAETVLTLHGQVYKTESQHAQSMSRVLKYNFQQSFTRQIYNVVAAIRGIESLRVTGEQGIRNLRLIEACYSQRTLIPMPWLDARELNRAQQLNNSKAR
jgi:predicted dehydrogenase